MQFLYNPPFLVVYSNECCTVDQQLTQANFNLQLGIPKQVELM